MKVVQIAEISITENPLTVEKERRSFEVCLNTIFKILIALTTPNICSRYLAIYP